MMNKGILFTALSALLYGSIGFFGARLLEQGLNVSAMLFWRFLFSCLLLTPLVPLLAAKLDLKSQSKTLISLFFLGATFHGLGTAMYFEASKSIGTGLAMVIFFTYPIFVVGWSWFLKKIIPTRSVFVALILIIIGCALIAYGNRDSSDVASALNIRGLALACASGLCYGTYVFYSKELTTLVSPILATFCVCLGTAFSFAIYIFLSSQTIVIPGTNYILTLLVLFAVVGTILPVFLLLAGIIYIPASTASIVSVLEPVAVLAVGALILDEPLQRIQLVGTLVILSATLLVATKKKAI